MATDSERIDALCEFYDSTSDSLPSWLDEHVEEGAPVLNAGSGTNAQKTANILLYETNSLEPWEDAHMGDNPPKPQHNGNDILWASATGSNVRVYWSGGNATISVSDALTDAEIYGEDNDGYIRENIEPSPTEEPPEPPPSEG